MLVTLHNRASCLAALVRNSQARFSYTTNVMQVPGSTRTMFVPSPR